MNVADEIRKIEEELRGIKQRLTSIRSGKDLPVHHTKHELGGSDPIKLDDLATPDDNIDLDASITKHGLLRKLDNVNTDYLDGQGNWTVPAGGGGGKDDYSWESVRCPERYYSSNLLANDSLASTWSLKKDRGYAMPFIVPCQQSFDRIGILVSIAKANSEVRIGIYEDDGQCYPGDLIVDSGILATDVAIFKEANIDEIFAAGLYWLVLNGTNPDAMTQQSLRTLARNYLSPQLGWSSPPAGGSFPAHYYEKNPMAYAALPDPFPAGASIMDLNKVIAIFLRKKNAIP